MTETLFKNAEPSANVTGIDQELLRFRTILIALGSGNYINVGAFKVYCKDTLVIYNNLYSW